MIAFVTLFLGLSFGVHNVEVSVGAEVARVELYIDGSRAVELGPPWKARIDLGGEIAPHELLAVAIDANGRRLGEARQWVNRATSAAEARFVLERDGTGRSTQARLVWLCPASPNPASISVSFDGRPLEVATPERFPLPIHEAETSHILLADLVFPGGETATAVASFGGKKTDDALQELTAVPVRISRGTRLPKVEETDGWFDGVRISRGTRRPNVEEMDGWFYAAGRNLRVAAVEEGPAEVVFVMADAVREELRRLATQDHFPWPWPRPRPLELAPRSRFRFMATVPKWIDGSAVVTRIYPASDEYTTAKETFLRLGKDAFLEELPAPPRIAEAVAAAGLTATRRERRRAVVLLLGQAVQDVSDFDAGIARRYLSRIRVPFYVWRVSPGELAEDGAWPGALDASTIEGMGRAFATLREDLASQRVVWLEGRVLPSEVAVTPEARGIVTIR